MRNLLTPALLLPLLTIPVENALAQDVCDSVVIEGIRYNAVDNDIIEIRAYFDGSDCIDYPTFILFDANGDTLAREFLNFFCLSFGSPATHNLMVLPDAQIPPGPFDARLELHTGFGDALVCSWDWPELQLCPPLGCSQAVITMTNLGDLEQFQAFWWIRDQDSGIQVATGNFAAGEVITDLDTTCLVPGHYVLEFTPFSPIDDEYVIGITGDWLNSIGTNVAEQGDITPLDLNFDWFEACRDIGNALPEMPSAAVQLRTSPGRIQLTSLDDSPLGTVSVLAMDGRLLAEEYAVNSNMSLSTVRFSSGIVLLRTLDLRGGSFTQRIFIP